MLHPGRSRFGGATGSFPLAIPRKMGRVQFIPAAAALFPRGAEPGSPAGNSAQGGRVRRPRMPGKDPGYPRHRHHRLTSKAVHARIPGGNCAENSGTADRNAASRPQPRFSRGAEPGSLPSAISLTRGRLRTPRTTGKDPGYPRHRRHRHTSRSCATPGGSCVDCNSRIAD